MAGSSCGTYLMRRETEFSYLFVVALQHSLGVATTAGQLLFLAIED